MRYADSAIRGTLLGLDDRGNPLTLAQSTSAASGDLQPIATKTIGGGSTGIRHCSSAKPCTAPRAGAGQGTLCITSDLLDGSSAVLQCRSAQLAGPRVLSTPCEERAVRPAGLGTSARGAAARERYGTSSNAINV
ncbi:MAG: hypothetical protein ACJA0P_002228 [Planctomycetota bacterium]|jgi:hypothetical protein